MERYPKRYTRDNEGKWHDGKGRTFKRKRDALKAHAEGCGCGQCINEYVQYEMRVREDRVLKRNVIANVSLSWQMLRNPGHSRFRWDEGSGEVFPVSDDYPDGDDVFDLNEHEDGETDK